MCSHSAVHLAPVDHSGYRQLSMKFCLKARQVGGGDIREEEVEEEKWRKFVC